MKATLAFHTLGDVSSDRLDWCVVTEEDAENYYGHWLTGLGFFDIRFPKATTLPITEEDQETLDALVPRLRVGGLSHAAQAYGDHPLPSQDPST